MSSDYRIKSGSGQSLVSLTVLSPQPMSEGVKATRRDFSGDGTVVEQGLYVELIWELSKNATTYQAILSTCGLASALSAAVTVYCRDDTYAYQRYNGIAIRPPAFWQRYRPRNIVILVRDLVLL